MPIFNIYYLVHTTITKLEKESIKYKKEYRDFSKLRDIKSQLFDLHELRRAIERLDSFKKNKRRK